MALGNIRTGAIVLTPAGRGRIVGRHHGGRYSVKIASDGLVRRYDEASLYQTTVVADDFASVYGELAGRLAQANVETLGPGEELALELPGCGRAYVLRRER